MPSLRTRLTLVLTVGIVLLLGVTGVLVARILAIHSTREFDAGLLARAHALVSLTEQEGGRIELDYDAAHMPEYERAQDPDLFQFWLDDGRMLLRSRRLTGDLARRETPGQEPRIRDAVLPDGRDGRVVDLAFVPKGPEEGADPEDAASEGEDGVDVPRGVVLAVARGRSSLDATLHHILLTVLGGAAVAALLGALLVRDALARGLRPLDRLAGQMTALDAERLDTTVCLDPTPRELAPVVDQLNALLERLSDSFDRERRFTGNVAHELRTPIAELGSLASAGATWPDDANAVAGYFRDVGDLARQMEDMIADLLLLARCEAGVEPVERRPVDLGRLVRGRIDALSERANARRLRLSAEGVEGLVVDSDPVKLAMIVANLLTNAVSHGRGENEVTVRATREQGTTCLEISNPAEALTKAELDRLTEPFWRKDPARSSGDHAGLGLAVARELAGLLGLALTFSQDPRGVFRARLDGLAQSPA